MSRGSIRQLRAVLHAALEQAVVDGALARNVADLVKAPKAERREMQALSPDQARVLLDAAKGDRLEALYVLALNTGMRQGELFGLRWRDIDFETRSLRVEQTLQKTPKAESGTGSGHVFGAPKTEKSRRRIELSQGVVDVLRRHRVAQARISDIDLVFTTATGAPLDGPNFLSRRFHPLLERAGLPRIRFHDLRHTAATLLLNAGQDVKTVSQMLGHSNAAMTLNVYAHATPATHRDAAEKLAKLLG